MGKNVDLKISFSRQSKHYHPGEVVSGECVLLLNDHLKLRFVSIEFQGESWTYWEETNLYTSIHKNAEIYFHKKTTLFGDCKYRYKALLWNVLFVSPQFKVVWRRFVTRYRHLLLTLFMSQSVNCYSTKETLLLVLLPSKVGSYKQEIHQEKKWTKGLCNHYQEGGAEKLEGGHYIKLLPR